MEYQFIANFLSNIPDKVSKFITKKRIEVHDEYGEVNNRYKLSKQTKFQTVRFYSQIYVITEMHKFLSKELLLLQEMIIEI